MLQREKDRENDKKETNKDKIRNTMLQNDSQIERGRERQINTEGPGERQKHTSYNFMHFFIKQA